MEELHCAVFPSVGYSDFIIVFMTDNLKKASDIIASIRGAQSEQKHEVFSNCYSVSGLDKNCFFNEDWLKNLPDQNDSRITMRINLREGISAYEFIYKLSAELNGNKELQRELKNSYYTTFGYSDCFILTAKPMNFYLKLYAEKQPFNPDSSFFQNYITSIRTSIGIDNAMTGELLPKEINRLPRKSGSERADAADRWQKEFQQFIDIYDEFLKKNNLHIRTSKALQRIMKNYIHLIQTYHGFDVEQVLGKAFRVFMRTTADYIELYDYLIQSDEEYKIKDALDIKNRLINTISLFKDYIGVFISDLVRSDRPFIEGNTLTHPSIGAATKLIFAYTKLLNMLTQAFGAEDKYTFLVASGGCDRTSAVELFSFAGPEDKINKLIIIMVPEMSLYDVQGTLFRILHECMHFIGNRKRKERFRFLMWAIGELLSWNVIYLEYSDKKIIFDEVLRLTEDIGLNIELENATLEIYEGCAKEIKNIITGARKISDYQMKEDEAFFYADVLLEDILKDKKMAGVFRRTDNEEGLAFQFYECLMEAHKRLIETLYERIQEKYEKMPAKDSDKKMKLYFALENINQLRIAYIPKYDDPKKTDKKLMDHIMSYMEFLFDNDFSTAFSDWEDKIIPLKAYDMDGLDPIESKIAYAELKYSDIVDSILSAMIECFSDCTAIRILKMPEADFILSFIYELWDTEQAFPRNVADTLRIGADLKVMYDIGGGLSDETKEQVRWKAAKRAEQGYEYKNVEDVLQRINYILEEYQTSALSGVREALEGYLVECSSDVGNEYSEMISELYEWCELDTVENIYSAIHMLFSLWMKIG